LRISLTDATTHFEVYGDVLWCEKWQKTTERLWRTPGLVRRHRVRDIQFAFLLANGSSTTVMK